MGPIAELTGAELAALLDGLRDTGDRLYKISFAIDGGIKIKLNEGSWSPPMGAIKGQN